MPLLPHRHFCPIDKDVEHLFLRCSGVAAIWHSYGLDEQQVASLAQLEDLWGLPLPDNALTPRVWCTILLAAVWNIWKRRNNKIFISIDETNTLTLALGNDEGTVSSNLLLPKSSCVRTGVGLNLERMEKTNSGTVTRADVQGQATDMKSCRILLLKPRRLAHEHDCAHTRYADLVIVGGRNGKTNGARGAMPYT
uniref:Reverse transcriptase zinc-binding domain-containing protein n=1 Tax=Oryza glumipatula TaxID=40148 RepID=A0A0D9YWE1_9ORYZ